MIKSTDKHVAISGNPIDVMQDFVNITRAVYNIFVEKLGKESANEVISLCGRISFADDSDEEEMYLERLADVITSYNRKNNS